MTTEDQQALIPTDTKETAASAVAAQAIATVQARYAIAVKMPRNWDQARVALLKECRRPRFAESAKYLKPVGKGVVGFSIRFVETALRCMTNAITSVTTSYDDADKRVVKVAVTDLESNNTYAQDVTIVKTVERSSGENRIVVGTRVNSQGSTVYVVKATDDDLLNKEGALVSKAIRTLGLRLIPGDLLDEAWDQIVETNEKADTKDPDEARKKMVDAFTAVGVQPKHLVGYLRHGIDTITSEELNSLRAVHAALKSGEATWADIVSVQKPDQDEKPKKSKTSRTKDALDARRKGEHDYGPAPMSAEEAREAMKATCEREPGED